MLAITPVNLKMPKGQNFRIKNTGHAVAGVMPPDEFVRFAGVSEGVNEGVNADLINTAGNSRVNFRGAPYKIDFSLMKIPEKGEILAKDAIRVYEKFKLGNYLDIGDDIYNFSRNSEIRQHNLSFLDLVKAPEEKKKFIEYYKELTGFPDLYKVSENIKIKFVEALMTASEILNKSYGNEGRHYYDVIQAGYDGVCSVGRHKALPGSDLDKAYVIIRGRGKVGIDDDVCVKNFKWKLWDNTDQRILSYNHDAAAFPQVYTAAQFKSLLGKADEACMRLNIKKSKTDENTLLKRTQIAQFFEIPTTAYARYKALQVEYKKDYIEANEFYIKLCEQFPGLSYGNKFKEPDKEMMKNIGFVIETMRDGVYFTKFGKMDYSILKNSVTFNLTNLSQLRALKNHNDMKPKRLAREKLQTDFPQWEVDKQYRFVKTLIESSCANNTDFTQEFREYFSRGGPDLFEPLIQKLKY